LTRRFQVAAIAKRARLQPLRGCCHKRIPALLPGTALAVNRLSGKHCAAAGTLRADRTSILKTAGAWRITQTMTEASVCTHHRPRHPPDMTLGLNLSRSKKIAIIFLRKTQFITSQHAGIGRPRPGRNTSPRNRHAR
jgi:hypothetical protein